MPISAHNLSATLFIRGLLNLKSQLTKAEAHAAANGIDTADLLAARLNSEASPTAPHHVSADLHAYSLSAHIHWAAEASRLAIEQLLGARRAPDANEAKSFADLHQRLDATIAYLQAAAPSELEAGLDRVITIEHRRGATQSSGGRFLIAFAIPHFYYHLTTAYGILRNQGVQLTMGDFLGNWGAT